MQVKFLALVLLIVVLSNDVVAQVWHQNGLIEYFVSDKEKNFDQAKSSCENLQATLVMIQTENVQLFLEALITNKTFPSGKSFMKFKFL